MAADARVSVNEGSEQQPSHRALDNGNAAAAAAYKPAAFRLDDINIDLISVIITTAAVISALLLRQQPAKLIVPATAAAATVLALRLFFPRPKPPQGLVLITGGSSGIGAELAYIFAEKGHDLVLVGRNEEQLEAVKNNVKEKFGRSAYTVAADLSLPGAAKQLYDHVTNEGFTVDVLVNNAGLGGVGDVLEQSIEFAERMTTLNCISLVQLTQLFGKDMVKRRRGWILQVSSVGGKSLIVVSSLLCFALFCF